MLSIKDNNVRLTSDECSSVNLQKQLVISVGPSHGASESVTYKVKHRVV